MRASESAPTVVEGSLGSGNRKSSYVMSDVDAPEMGGFE
jgi:hypothetical protein